MLRSWNKQNDCYNLCNGATTTRQTILQTPTPFLTFTCLRIFKQWRYRSFYLKVHFRFLSIKNTSRRSQWPRGLRLVSAAIWENGLESCWGHGCLSVVSVVCCKVEVFTMSRSLVQRSSTECLCHWVWSGATISSTSTMGKTERKKEPVPRSYGYY